MTRYVLNIPPERVDEANGLLAEIPSRTSGMELYVGPFKFKDRAVILRSTTMWLAPNDAKHVISYLSREMGMDVSVTGTSEG
jgi:hypothetical protein